MTTTTDFDIVGSYNNQRVTSIDAERSVNLFEYRDPLGKKRRTLINTSGIVNTNYVFGAETRGFRAQFVFKTDEYLVVGSSAYRVSQTGSLSFLGTFVNTNSGYVGVDANTFQVIFVDGVNGYIWDTLANTFTMIKDTSFPASPIDVCNLDGYFVVANGNTNTFQLSSFNQGIIWGAASNFFSASAITNLITIGESTIGGSSNTDNYQTGVSVTVVAPDTGDEFTADATTDLLTLTDTTNYPTGAPVMVSNQGGALPEPLDDETTYFAINASATTLQLALTYADAIANTPIDLTTDGTGTQTIIGKLPQPLEENTTYYVINKSSSEIQLATTFNNAISNIPIVLESAGGGNNTINSDGQLQLGSITSHPGTITACRTLHRRLFLFSQFFTEVWENAGAGSNLPFRRNNSLLMEYGTICIGSIAVGFDVMFFLSQTRDGLGSVMEVPGTGAIPISTRALDFQLSQYASLQQIADCRAFLIKENGLIFYRMNFTEANHTFVYNVTLSNPQGSDQDKLWHEEEVLNGDRHPAQTHAYFNGNNYVGSYDSPILYQISSDAFTNDGQDIRRMRITRSIVPEGYQRIRIDRLQIDLLQGNINNLQSQFEPIALLTESGINLLTEDDDEILLEQENLINNPKDLYVFLSISRDGGQTYGYRIKAPMGKVGERSFRTLWRKLGVIPRGQGFVAKFEFFDAVPFIVLGAAWAVELLPE